MKKSLLFWSLLFSGIVNAQDPQFSMPYSTSMYTNPAFAGTSGESRVQSCYRNQWPNISGNYITTFLSYDQYIKALTGGVGISYLQEAAGQGTMLQDRIGITYSNQVPDIIVNSDRFKICTALELAYVQKTINWDKMNFGSSISSSGVIYNSSNPGSGKQAVSYVDCSMGMLGYNENFFAGLVVWHLTEPDQGFISQSPLPMKYVANCGINIGNPDSLQDFSVTPSALYLQQENFRSFVIQCAVNYSNCAIGIGYRTNDAIIGSIGFRAKTLRVAYSYDITIGSLGIVTAGSHEISLSFAFNRKNMPEGFRRFSALAF